MKTALVLLFIAISFTAKAADPLFKNFSILNLQIKADFQHIKKATENDGSGSIELLNRDLPKYYTNADIIDLASPQRVLKAQIRARGMSNLWDGEAEFPKIRIEFVKDENFKNSIFAGNRKLKFNTHVTTNPTTKYTPMGRLKGEISPFREALAYEMARVLELPGPLTRRARVAYTDLGTNESFTRNALMIEPDKSISERTGARIVPATEFIDGTTSKIDPLQAAKFFLLHCLLGNIDIGLRVHERQAIANYYYRPLFNTTVFEKPDGTRFPIVYDFDLASIVRGLTEDPISLQPYNYPTFGLRGILGVFAYAIIPLRHRFTEKELFDASVFLRSRKNMLINLVQQARVDDEGRAIAMQHVTYFFRAMYLVLSYELINAEGVKFYKAADRLEQKIKSDPSRAGQPGSLRLGTPVRVLGKENGMLKVEIIDYNFDLERGETNVGYIDSSTPISRSFPDTEVGKIDPREFIQF